MAPLQELKKLKNKIRKGCCLGARIEFLVITYRNNLSSGLNSYQYFDEYDVGERDFDTCLEMGDAEDVIHGLFDQAMKEPTLLENLKANLNDATYDMWHGIYQKITDQQQDLFA